MVCIRAAQRDYASRSAVFAIALVFAVPFSCDTPDAVARFSSSAIVTLRSGDSLFDDMRGTCVREAQTREPFGSFSVSDAPAPAVCDDVGKQAEGLKAASKILSNYFTALNDLASFGTSKTGDDVKGLLAKASAQAKLSAARQDALGSIAGLLTRVVTAGYQQKKLADDVAEVHGDIKAVLDGLGEAAGVVYLHQLQEEEQKTAISYKGFLKQHQEADAALLILDSRWQTDRANFSAKENAARSYQAALATLARGNEDLAAHARSLKKKELFGLLSPYAAQLESLAPAIQKAFF